MSRFVNGREVWIENCKEIFQYVFYGSFLLERLFMFTDIAAVFAKEDTYILFMKIVQSVMFISLSLYAVTILATAPTRFKKSSYAIFAFVALLLTARIVFG